MLHSLIRGTDFGQVAPAKVGVDDDRAAIDKDLALCGKTCQLLRFGSAAVISVGGKSATAIRPRGSHRASAANPSGDPCGPASPGTRWVRLNWRSSETTLGSHWTIRFQF